MANMSNDLNRQNLPAHKEAIAKRYEGATIVDVTDQKLGFDLIIKRDGKTDLLIECKTCYANTPNIAMEFLAATRETFKLGFNADNSFRAIKPRHAEYQPLQSLIERAMEEPLPDSKDGALLQAHRKAMPSNHLLSYIRAHPDKRTGWIIRTRQFADMILKERTKMNLFVTYTEVNPAKGIGAYNTVGILVDENKFREREDRGAWSAELEGIDWSLFRN